MRNTIDVDVANDSVDLVCSVSADAAESCINFIVDHDITVTLARDGTETSSEVQSVKGIACYMLDDACLRRAGEFTVETEGITPLRFFVEMDVPESKQFMICYLDGMFYIRYSTTSSSGSGGAVESVNGQTGAVVLYADDIGAARKQHTHKPADIGAAKAEHTHAADDVGALPADGTAVDSNKLGGVGAQQYALKSEIPIYGGGMGGMYALHIDDNGHLICTYDGSEPPPLSIDENGHLIYTIGA